MTLKTFLEIDCRLKRQWVYFRVPLAMFMIFFVSFIQNPLAWTIGVGFENSNLPNVSDMSWLVRIQSMPARDLVIS